MSTPTGLRMVWESALLEPAFGIPASVIVLGFGGICCGRLARSCSLPQISGFVFFGCFAVNTELLVRNGVEPLRFLAGPALGTIAIRAGAELREGSDCGTRKSNGPIAFALTMYAVTFITTFVFFLAGCRFSTVHFLGSFAQREQLAAALICAGISTDRSPVSALAVVKELAARGPFTSCCLQVSILLDALTVFAFPFFLVAAQAIVSGGGVPVDGPVAVMGKGRSVVVGSSTAAALALLPLCRLCVSVLLGHGIAVMTASVSTRFEGLGRKITDLTTWKFALVLLCWWLFSYSQHAEVFGLGFLCWDPILVCLVVGAGGLRRQESDIGVVVVACEGVAKGANLIFFVLAGTSLDLEQTISALVPAVGLTCARLAGLRLGSSLAGAIVGRSGRGCGAMDGLSAGRYWMGFVTQAGISIALITDMRAKFTHGSSGLAEVVYSVLLSSITLNQLIGPPLFKRAIVAAGEAHSEAK